MYIYLYKSVIYNVSDIDTIKELKKYIANKFETINEANVRLSYTINKNTFQPNDNDVLIPYIMYMLTIKPIDCSIHKF
jgi:hypothetical protein